MTIRVTIFEDNNSLRNSLYQLINGTDGFSCVGAFGDCLDLFKNIEASRPDVVLMDIEMPGTNGLKGLKIIKDKFPNVSVIMLTVFEDNDSIFDAICAGASGYLLKKTSHDKIVESIHDVLNGGAPITSSIARKVLNLFPKTPAQHEEINKLAPREQEVLQLLVSGHSYKMIAEKCGITLETVRSHIKRIYEKLQVQSATEAAAKTFMNKGR